MSGWVVVCGVAGRGLILGRDRQVEGVVIGRCEVNRGWEWELLNRRVTVAGE